MNLSVFEKLRYLLEDHTGIMNAHRADGRTFGTEVVLSLPRLNAAADRNRLKTVGNTLREYGAVSTHLPFYGLDFSCPDKHIAEYSVRTVTEALDISPLLRCDRAVCHTGYSPQLPRRAFSRWFDTFLVAKQRLEEHAEQVGVTILWENTYEDDLNFFREIVAAHPNTRFCIDVGHVHCFSPFDTADLLHVLQNRVIHAHLHDNDGSEDSHSALGRGTIDMELTASLLNDASVQTVVLELDHTALRDSMPSVEKYLNPFAKGQKPENQQKSTSEYRT